MKKVKFEGGSRKGRRRRRRGRKASRMSIGMRRRDSILMVNSLVFLVSYVPSRERGKSPNHTERFSIVTRHQFLSHLVGNPGYGLTDPPTDRDQNMLKKTLAGIGYSFSF